ncbi:GNAT family N-acetyltransferase [Actinoplanes sp. DH11]|uniref:GNAT family N-acetyltransferase n=1 Tax=Actinoplanes sp. DH11 TaxID=2857011 RepID=UPI001E572163|nr:GNAT family N-acetyltransferase [Actinoplanes sp. DH11]
MTEIRDLDGLAEWTAASALYRAVFGYTGPEWGLSPRLLAALRQNSGTVVGAFEPDGTLVGFCYGFTAVEDGEIYHYSQAAVVAPGAQGGGIGRELKRAQAAAARRTGARSMRWTFDPYALRNAHFNLTVLGVTGIRFLPDHYGEAGTDRVLVSWRLTGDAPARTPGSVSVPAPAGDRIAAPEPADRLRLRRQLADRFAAGDRLTGVARVGGDPGRVAYTFENGAS